MNAQHLFDAITNVREEHITAAEKFRFAQKRQLTGWLCTAAALVLVIGLGAAAVQHDILPGGKTGSGSSEAGSAYMAYAGPIFPLDTAEAIPSLTAERRITLDFSPYDDYVAIAYDGSEYTRYDDQLAVTDTALLTNTGNDALTVTAIYPFMGNLTGSAELLPTITVNGQRTAATLHAGEAFSDVGENTPDSWSSLAPLLEDGSYRAAALSDTAFSLLEQPVTVYEISDLTAPENTDAPNPVLDLSFVMDPERTTIITWGSTGGTVTAEEGRCSRHFDICNPGEPSYGQNRFLLVFGEDISGLKVQGYAAGIATPGEELEGGTANITRYQSTLGTILSRCFAILREKNPEFPSAAAEQMDETILLGLAAQALSTDIASTWEGSIEDAFNRVRGCERLLYLTFELTLAPGESTEVTAAFRKQPSYDYYGHGTDRNGYDLVTLTHHLRYTRHTAVLQNIASVELLRQDFGFNPENNVMSVLLTGEHYSLEVRKKD